MSERPNLRRLARACGIECEFVDAFGKRRRAGGETLEAILAAMGVEASSEAASARTLAQLEGQARLLEPVRVCAAGPPATRVGVDLPLNAGMQFSWTASWAECSF